MNQSNSFSKILPLFLQQAVLEIGFTEFTPIQEEVIPLILQRKDIAAQAETGSGKTAAYGLSLLQQVKIPLTQVQFLVIVPTRELVMQVQKELKSLGKYTSGLKTVTVYGDIPSGKR
ncbi:DEAD/DEAH box helicase [Rhodocytophaga rosea]|uniref:DEAD/DEAH box helicase n=1 Tax=Rhodocytophaga rosea TaxID=2704465 RepID=A0A6C0GP88_9BACT|nr:DEAD/DEAH box helicase [Rhodocytophaga rosea]QHT69859.1 DEAD/DEAH box helicase [Rhodocytophaga rosea]